jgi:CheY-like chemotaxis protein
MVLVLIADDDTAIRQWIRAVAEVAGHVVLEAANGAAAWTSVQAHRPDVVLLDVRMPERDGLAVAQAVKEDPVLAGTRVVMLSGSAEDAQAALAAGADAYLVKPCSVATLQASLLG